MSGSAYRKGAFTPVLILALFVGTGCSYFERPETPEPAKARLLLSLPETCNTPDGMALDPQNNIILSCPNFNNPEFPGILMKIDPQNNLSVFYELPLHPETKKAGPMGLEFGPNGHLYLADNQYFTDENRKSRLLRIEFKEGKPEKTTVVASGFYLANAVRVRGSYVYVTDTLVRKDTSPLISGVYRFKLEEEGVTIKPGTEDPHLIATLETHNPQLHFGADGMAFDSKGNLYVGNFADGTVHKISFDAEGNVVANAVFAKSPQMKSADGLLADSRDNIYVADSMANAVQVLAPDGSLTTLVQNGDTDGSDGGLDQPCEVIIRGQQMVVANFDMPFAGCINTTFDAPYTLSVVDLNR